MVEVINKKQKTEDFSAWELKEWFDEAKVTCEVLVANMVNPDIMNHLFFALYKQVTFANVMKLLLRVDQLYFARYKAF